MRLPLEIMAAALLLPLSSCFSIAETALLSLSRLQLARLRKVQAGRLQFWEENPEQVLSGLLLGSNLVQVGLGVLAVDIALLADARGHLPFRYGGWLIPGLAVALTVLFGEILPKVLARRAPEPLALFFAPATRFVSVSLGPPLRGVVKGVGRLLSVLSRTVRRGKAQWDAPMIATFLQRSSLSGPYRFLLRNLLAFNRVVVHHVMVHRQEVFALEVTLPRATFLDRALGSAYSRVPVYRGSEDQMLGVLYTKDLLAFIHGGPLFVLEDLIRPAYEVGPLVPLTEVLPVFRRGHHHMAFVKDERGKLLGLITLQDVLEAIVGPLAEEPEWPLQEPS